VFGFRDPEIERIVARNAATIAEDEAKGDKTDAEKEGLEVPDRYQDVSLEAMLNASHEAKEAMEAMKKEALPEPLEDMESSVKSGLMDMALDQAKEHVRFFDALDIHFPGVGELLNTVSGAMTETLAERKRARDQAVARSVSSRRPSVLEIEQEQ